LADTLEDRAVIVTLQRKARTAMVERLRKRDCDDFATLRRQGARWAADNFDRLTDPDPRIPDALNDRAADNWRPLLAIADLVAGDWPRRAREAACLLSGEGHDSTSINVELLADIRAAFGEEDVIRSADLVAALVADPERPWAEWRRGRPLTPKQLGGLLRPFGIISEEVHPAGLAHGKGYRRNRFEETWAAYCPASNLGQNTSRDPEGASETRNRASAEGMGTTRDFRKAQEASPRGSKNANLSYSHAGLRGCADRKPESGAQGQSDHENRPAGNGHTESFPLVCQHCGAPEQPNNPVQQCACGDGLTYLLHRNCQREWLGDGGEPSPAVDPWADLDIPGFLDRRPNSER
jgi:hypothetical protein